MTVGRAAVRSQQWWNHKIPPVIAAAALTMGASTRGSSWTEIGHLALFLVAASGIAAFGHVLNDLTDLTADAHAGKRNVLTLVGPWARVLLIVGTLVVGLVPFRWLAVDAAAAALVVTELALLIAYSTPPVRLKERGLAGPLADAGYAYVVPVALTVAVFAGIPGGPTVAWWVMAPVLVWALLMGLRGIVWHQVIDLDNDLLAGVPTFVTSVGRERAVALAAGASLVELAVAAVAVVAVVVATGDVWLAVFGILYLVWRTFQLAFLWDEPLLAEARHDREQRLRLTGFVIVNEFVERWLPLAALVALAIGHPPWWLVVGAYVLLFDNALADFVSKDAHGLPDALERLALERRTRRWIADAADLRARALAAGPASVSEAERAARRWVFVVCGPEMHILTLHTALRHLRPLTSLEIWVVTDGRRNEVEIDAPLADHVVDVRTPLHLDDHQASIWLKTGLHRHLPSGEWCYLDTDIIAVAPGMEQVFDHRGGPVAFASDLTISANQVDRFSPWAMTCDCSGNGEQHSCEHLRLQLKDRLGLDVPGDWVHWNGGVFVFGPDAAPVMDMWNQIAVDSFEWPEWRTRDQGALIATVWAQGLQGLPRLPSEFNFIADLGNGDLCLEPERGWALHPSGPWLRPHLLHLYTSRLEDPDWDMARDVEEPVIRQTTVRELKFRGELITARIRRLPRRLRPHRIAASLRRRVTASASAPIGVGQEQEMR